jgi:hypothetical protein
MPGGRSSEAVVESGYISRDSLGFFLIYVMFRIGL